MSEHRSETEVRRTKREQLRAAGVPLHPERFERSHTLAEAGRLSEGTEVRVAGRLAAVRTFGKLTFAHLQDVHGRLQVALRKGELDDETWQRFHDYFDRGDFAGVAGALFVTKRGELTVNAREITFLGKALAPLPEKWKGLADPEIRQRQRYVDLVMSDETRARFKLRTSVVRTLRRFLDDHGFDEVETPVLQTVPSGASARPFLTHHNALDLDVYLRIAPETWLKRLVAGGYDRVYEMARCFRNEGMDPSHLQDFTMLEYYCAYWSWEDNMRFTEKMFRHLLDEVLGSQQIEWRGRTIDFSGEWPRVDMGDLVREKTGIDVASLDADGLRAAIREHGLFEEGMERLGRGALIDIVYKRTVRGDLVQPCFLTGIPADALPLARRNENNPAIADCFQLLVNGWEIVKAYSELVDPYEQRRLFQEQERLRTGGDDEAMHIDEDYLRAMEFGLPPISGWGMGIDRLCALLTGADSLRDVVLFPLLRPEARPETPDSAPAPDTAASDPSKPAPAPPKPTAAGAPDTSGDVGEFGLTRAEAMELFKAHVHTDYLTKHCLASAIVMEGVAARFDKNRDTYWCMGLLHDLDFETVKEPDRHTRETVRLMRGAGVTDETIIKAVLAHNAEGLGDIERDCWLDYALSCAETITGLVMAAAKVLPDKKLASLKPSSVKKRMKKKDFAKQVSREAILQCEKIGLTLEEFCALAVESMRTISDDLGL